jgi:hypothetical protein
MGHSEVIVGMDGDVSDFRGHAGCLLIRWILFKVAAFCQQAARSAV